MDYELKMPDLSAASDEVKINEWYIGEGETVQRGQALLSVETDKAEMDVESVVSGRIKQILSNEEQIVIAGQIIAIIEVEQAPEQRGRAAPGETEPAKPSAESNTPAPLPPEVPDRPAAESPPPGPPGMFQRNRQRRGET